MTRTILLSFFLFTLSVSAQWRIPARQVSVRTNDFDNLSQVPDTTNAPSGSLQAVMEWVDDYWDTNSFSTNTSYYFVDGTTQSFWRVVVRDYLTCNNGASVATNFYVGNSAWVSNDLYVADALFVGDDATVGDTLTVSNDLFVGDDATVGGDLVVTGAITAGSLSTTGSLAVGSLTTSGDLLNLSNDLAVSFMGYPRVLLYTSQVTVVSGGASPLGSAAWSNWFDGDINSWCTETGNANNVSHFYVIDLTNSYTGWLVIRARIKLATSSTAGWGAGSSEAVVPTYGGANLGTYYTQVSCSETSFFETNTLTAPLINTRYVVYAIHGASSVATYYQAAEILFYGTTNSFRNLD